MRIRRGYVPPHAEPLERDLAAVEVRRRRRDADIGIRSSAPSAGGGEGGGAVGGNGGGALVARQRIDFTAASARLGRQLCCPEAGQASERLCRAGGSLRKKRRTTQKTCGGSDHARTREPVPQGGGPWGNQGFPHAKIRSAPLSSSPPRCGSRGAPRSRVRRGRGARCPAATWRSSRSSASGSRGGAASRARG